MFPNKFAVYLHDTPSRDLFQQDVRMFSSGCIRIAEPMALAAFLLDGNPAWTVNTLKQAAETGKTKVIRLKKTVPVHLNYLTAWGAADGTTPVPRRYLWPRYLAYGRAISGEGRITRLLR